MISDVVVVRAVVELTTRPTLAILLIAGTLVLLDVRLNELRVDSGAVVLTLELDEEVDETACVRAALDGTTEEEEFVELAARKPAESALPAIETTATVDEVELVLKTTVADGEETVADERETVVEGEKTVVDDVAVDKLTLAVSANTVAAPPTAGVEDTRIVELLLLRVAEVLDLSHAVQGCPVSFCRLYTAPANGCAATKTKDVAKTVILRTCILPH